jgi:hypothetical protein
MNEPQILKEQHILKQIETTNKPQFFKDDQTSNETQISNKPQNFEGTPNYEWTSKFKR